MAGEERDSDKRTMGVEMSAAKKNYRSSTYPPLVVRNRSIGNKTMGVGLTIERSMI